jgi:hypothetical protein
MAQAVVAQLVERLRYSAKNPLHLMWPAAGQRLLPEPKGSTLEERPLSLIPGFEVPERRLMGYFR